MTSLPFDLARVGAGLPVADVAEEITTALATGTVVVQAPPGTGKTTFLPPLVSNLVTNILANRMAEDAGEPGGPTERVIVTQPRRVAARAAASRLAALTGSAVGETVGYTVRGQRSVGPRTVVEFVTPGILLRRLIQDPELPGVAAVLLDEVHERSLDSDLLVGMLSEVRVLRADLKLVAVSATVDTGRFAALLPTDDGDPAAVVKCPSVLHPLDVVWAPSAGPRLDERGVTREFLTYVGDTALNASVRAHREDPQTDALVFLPGAWEVSYVAEHLRARAKAEARELEVLELHGRVCPREQDRAVAGRRSGDRPRIVVSTALAESSLTVPGVRLVIDSGLSREPRRDTVRGMSGLVTVSAARASAEQRAGRAARLGPGRVVRCYDERAWAAMPEHITPEIASADLTGAALMLAVWGTPGGQGLALPHPPPERALAAAQSVLRALGATEEDGRATALGRRLASIPADPRIARALLDGADLVGARAAAEVVALLTGEFLPTGGDLAASWRELRGPTAGRASASAVSRASKDGWQRETRRFERLARELPRGREEGRGPQMRSAEPVGQEPGAVVALARPEWIARKDGESYLLAGGSRAGLPAGSALSHHEWLAVAEVSRAVGRATAGTGAVIRSAAPLSREVAETVGAAMVRETVTADFTNGRVTARRQLALGAIVLSSTPVTASPEVAVQAVRSALDREGLGLLPWSEAAEQLRSRMRTLHGCLGQPWPAVDDDALVDRLEEWFGPELDALARGTRLKDLALEPALRRLLPWPEAARLEELAPQRLPVPSGSTARVHWDGQQPVVRVKLQECFGLADSPRLVDGRLPVLFHLLSPAGRELAITADLRSFWEGPYAQVRAEMRGRYPKHPWPEDPWSAPATARTKSRM